MMPNTGKRVPQGLADDRLGLWEALLQQFGLQRLSQYVRQHWSGQRLVIAIPWVWLFLFFVVPFLCPASFRIAVILLFIIVLIILLIFLLVCVLLEDVSIKS